MCAFICEPTIKMIQKAAVFKTTQSIMDLAQGQGRAAFYYTHDISLHVSERDFSDCIFSLKIRWFILKERKNHRIFFFISERDSNSPQNLNILKRELLS